MNIVYVKWLDASGTTEQFPIKDTIQVLKSGYLVETIGFLLKKNKKGLFVCQDLVLNRTETRCGIFIPHGMIQEIQIFTVKISSKEERKSNKHVCKTNCN